jgi:hypothetical protein
MALGCALGGWRCRRRTQKKGDKIAPKFASAHDLADRLISLGGLVMPTVLPEWMRQADISTTMKYYVGQNAEATADAVWAAQYLNSPNSSVEPQTRTVPSAL